MRTYVSRARWEQYATSYHLASDQVRLWRLDLRDRVLDQRPASLRS